MSTLHSLTSIGIIENTAVTYQTIKSKCVYFAILNYEYIIKLLWYSFIFLFFWQFASAWFLNDRGHTNLDRCYIMNTLLTFCFHLQIHNYLKAWMTLIRVVQFNSIKEKNIGITWAYILNSLLTNILRINTWSITC